VAEAMACGTPVITASGGGVVELIEQGRTGLVVALSLIHICYRSLDIRRRCRPVRGRQL